MLRLVVFLYGVLALAGAVVLAAQHVWWIALYLGVNGALVAGGLLFERGRYRPTPRQLTGHWETTGERFVDPTSGTMIEVRYNPETGEREYTPADKG
jgi:hypothetical protein